LHPFKPQVHSSYKKIALPPARSSTFSKDSRSASKPIKSQHPTFVETALIQLTDSLLDIRTESPESFCRLIQLPHQHQVKSPALAATNHTPFILKEVQAFSNTAELRLLNSQCSAAAIRAPSDRKILLTVPGMEQDNAFSLPCSTNQFHCSKDSQRGKHGASDGMADRMAPGRMMTASNVLGCDIDRLEAA
jgi:hypothetical protein